MDAGAYLAVVALVVLAGCGAAPFAGGDERLPDETLTPVPITVANDTATPKPADVDSPPGIWTDGHVNIDRLRSVHDSRLENQTYTWVVTYSVGATGNETPTQDFTRRVLVGQDDFKIEQYRNRSTFNVSMYVANGTGYQRTLTSKGPEYARIVRPGTHLQHAFANEMLQRYFSGLNLDVSLVTADGETYYRLYSPGGDVPEPLRDSGTISNYIATAYVSQDGIVDTVAVSYDLTRDGERRHVTFRYEYSAIGETSVSKPAWVSEVPPQVTTPRGNVTATPGTSTATDAPNATTSPTVTATENATPQSNTTQTRATE